jgi:hypothetical protein
MPGLAYTYTFPQVGRRRMGRVLVPLWYAVHFLSGFGGRGPGIGLRDRIPLDDEVRPSYDCHGWQLFPLLPL